MLQAGSAAVQPADYSKYRKRIIRLLAFIPTMARRNLASTGSPHDPSTPQEERAMFVRNACPSYVVRVFAGLAVAFVLAAGSLTYAVSHIQVVA